PGAGDLVRALAAFEPALVDGGFLGAVVAPVEENKLARMAVGLEVLLEVLLRSPGFGEDDGLACGTDRCHLLEPGFQRLEQRAALRVDADVAGLLGKAC